MSNKFLSFMSDEHLINCIDTLFNKYMQCQQNMTLSHFYRNKVDPIKFYFDMKFNNLDDIQQALQLEIIRQNDKTISNAIGEFHQSLIGGLPGIVDLKVGNGCDICNNDKTIFGEIKNKHNTMNSSSAENTFKKLMTFANEYPNSTCYLIEIIAAESQDIYWEGKLNGHYYSHDRVRRISVDKFYELVTGIPDAFHQLCMILPQVTEFYLSKINKDFAFNTTCNTLFNQFNNRITNNKPDILSLILSDTFISYNGF